MRVARILVWLCMMVGLAGCYTSDKPLLSASDAATDALPPALKLVALDAGGIVFDQNGKLSEIPYVWHEQGYLGGTDQATALTLHALDGPPGTYLLQMAGADTTVYSLVTVKGSRLAIPVADHDNIGRIAARLKEAGATDPGDGAMGSFKVSDRSHLLAAAELEASLPSTNSQTYLLVLNLTTTPAASGLPEAHDQDDGSGHSPLFYYTAALMEQFGFKGATINLAGAAMDYRKAAEGGIADAMTQLGRMLEVGQGVAANPAEANEWYRKAVLLGDIEATFRIGMNYLRGLGADQDSARGMALVTVAAASGSVEAMRTLAGIYEKGDPVEVDRPERLYWLVKAAEAGDREAAKLVANAVLAGDGTTQNGSIAVYWQNLASAAPTPLTALLGKDLPTYTTRDRQLYMMGFLDMLWSIGDRLTAQGLNGDCAEGYAMDNASNASNGLTQAMDASAAANPDANLSELAATFVYGHCDTRRNLLLLDFYVLNFSGAAALSPEDTDIFVKGAMSGAVQAHRAASKQAVADCIEHYYDDDIAHDDLIDKSRGDDTELVTNVMMRQLDVLCPY